MDGLMRAAVGLALACSGAAGVSPADLSRFPGDDVAQAAVARLEALRVDAVRAAGSYGFAAQREEAWGLLVDPVDAALAAWTDLHVAHVVAGSGGTYGWPPRTCADCLRSLRGRIGAEAYQSGQMPW